MRRFFSSDLVPLAYGIEVNEILLSLVSGATGIKIDQNPRAGKSSGYVFFHLPEGTVCSVKGYNELEKLPDVHRAYLPKMKIGDIPAPLTDKGDRFGPILIKGRIKRIGGGHPPNPRDPLDPS